jgi:hypothetical protein
VKPAYRDILAVAGGAPVEWWDGNGVPRFWPFEPGLLGVYDQLAVLYEIACQSCRATFPVSEGAKRFDIMAGSLEVVESDLPALVARADYGDPPRHDMPGRPGERCAGETMSSVPTRIVEAWEQVNFDWVRRPGLEGPVPD